MGLGTTLMRAVIAALILIQTARAAEVDTSLAEALFDAALANRVDVARSLLDSGVPVDGRDALGNTALLHAAVSGHVEMAALLVERGADAAAKNRDGDGAAALMAQAIRVRVCLAQRRDSMRSYHPTHDLRRMTADLAGRYGAVAAVLGIDAPSGPQMIMAAEGNCSV